MSRVLLALALLLLAAPVRAQDCESSCTMVAGQTFVALTELTPGASSYRIRVNGAAPVSAAAVTVNGRIEFTFLGGLPTGTYAFAIEALSATTWTVTTQPQTLTVLPPTSTTTASPSGTEIPTATEIVDLTGARWTRGPDVQPGFFQALRNGVYMNGWGRSIFWDGQSIYVLSPDTNWYRLTGSVWVSAGTTKPGVVTPPLPPQATSTVLVTPTRCRVTATISSTPDGQPGWSAEFLRGTTRIGSIDSTAPYTQTSGEITASSVVNTPVTVRWTKTGQATQVVAMGTATCRP